MSGAPAASVLRAIMMALGAYASFSLMDTLVKLLSGRLPPLAGEIHKSGKLKVGYFAQFQTDELDVRLGHAIEELPVDDAAAVAVRGHDLFQTVGPAGHHEKDRRDQRPKPQQPPRLRDLLRPGPARPQRPPSSTGQPRQWGHIGTDMRRCTGRHCGG